MTITKPEPALLEQQPTPQRSFDESTDRINTTLHERPKSEYDPCANAKVASPFYQYNHDPPRPSENKPRPDINISVHDLEKGLTPQPTNVSRMGALEKRISNDSGHVRNGSWRRFGFGGNDGLKRCMTKPKESRWKSIPRRQRLIIKILLSIILIGLIVGLAVGLTKALNGGVWRSNNSTSTIH